MLRLVFALAAVAHLAAASPTYKIPSAMSEVLLESDGCILPEAFVVQDFYIWTPSAGNNSSEVINFDYADNSTSIKTKCHFNATSVNVGPEGLTPRYACDNTVVQFIWEDNRLTMIEKACPENSQFEASGSVTPHLICSKSAKNSTVGEGNACSSTEKSIAAKFTSLQPTPK
ncbi:hypothetical protein C8A03DRAFT_13600 [Achaetomium macrosporum]|uniref:AA1-like domain-containing protein n=1 Tax=Achaetomium macrosporum TaxID=79813 RepID=A0AAN7CFA8_9PEZI|nr:hypothetical protein C8A03DRAFT_13600 [Achaetomium macrosporum]